MRYPAAETAEKHARILDEAAKLFRAKGFDQVSVAELMQAAGLTHGAFYAHFRSKADLAQESLDHILQATLVERFDKLSETQSPHQIKAKFQDRYLSPRHRDAPDQGCALPSLASDVARNPGLRPVFTRHLKAFITRLGQQFPWRAGRDPEAEAIAYLARLVGAMVLARAVDDPAFSEKILNSLREDAHVDNSSL
ncbi:MAG: TetR/AcrR family transcriptional regulator [Mangrovicoccus sp.]|nr:TetR/AcrR family transcriptional regulator [Mangrovicoccus sp.]